MRSRSLYWAAAIGVALVGCGDDGGDGKTGSGVSSSKRVNELTTEEFGKVCTNLQGKFDDVATALVKVTCTTKAILAGDSCAEQRDQCIDDTPSSEVFDEKFECTSPPETLEENCDATVGEMEACANALVKWANDLSNKLTCDAELSDLEDLEMEEPEACQKLDSACGLNDVVEGGVTGAGEE